MNKQEKLVNVLLEKIIFLKEDFNNCSAEKKLKIQIEIKTLEFCINTIQKIFNEDNNTELSSLTEETNSFTTPINRNNSNSSTEYSQKTYSDDEITRNDVSPTLPIRKPSSIV